MNSLNPQLLSVIDLSLISYITVTTRNSETNLPHSQVRGVCSECVCVCVCTAGLRERSAMRDIIKVHTVNGSLHFHGLLCQRTALPACVDNDQTRLM